MRPIAPSLSTIYAIKFIGDVTVRAFTFFGNHNVDNDFSFLFFSAQSAIRKKLLIGRVNRRADDLASQRYAFLLFSRTFAPGCVYFSTKWTLVRANVAYAAYDGYAKCRHRRRCNARDEGRLARLIRVRALARKNMYTADVRVVMYNLEVKAPPGTENATSRFCKFSLSPN